MSGNTAGCDNQRSESPVLLNRRRLLSLFLTAGVCQTSSAAPLALRITPENWGAASPVELEKVLLSAGETLWRHFPQREVPRFVVQRGRHGPIVHFKKNLAGETVMQLDAEGRHWAQFAYQFAHEFCHILANFEEDWNGNLWFEETLCETASLFTLRAMARSWQEHPPYPNWKPYADAIKTYAQDVMKTRQPLRAEALAEFYAKYAEKLRFTPTNRAMNGAMSLALLPLLEAVPSRWEAISWLNSSPSLPGESFPEYLAKWEAAVPPKHTGFVRMIRKLYLGKLD